MTTRKRMTARTLIAEKRSDGVFPGDIGNPEREKLYRDPDSFKPYEFEPGWDLTEDNRPWEDDKRDPSTNIPEITDPMITARAATMLATALLGDDVSDEELEEQTRDFMRMGHRSIIASLNRFKASPEPEEEPGEPGQVEGAAGEGTPTATATPTAGGTPQVSISPVASATPTAGVESTSTPPAAPTATENSEVAVASAEGGVIGAEGEGAAPGIEEEPYGEFVQTAGEGDEAPEMVLQIDEAAPEMDACSMFASEGELNQAEPDATLASAMFQGSLSAPAAPTIQASAPAPTAAPKAPKAGIKRIAGQPKITAGAGDRFDGSDLAGCWTGIKVPGLDQ